jgi:hypothetical protein
LFGNTSFLETHLFKKHFSYSIPLKMYFLIKHRFTFSNLEV